MKYCQGPICHAHKTKDRIRGPKGDKHYETRRRSHLYYNNRTWTYVIENRLLGERRPITAEQYNDESFTLNQG